MATLFLTRDELIPQNVQNALNIPKNELTDKESKVVALWMENYIENLTHEDMYTIFFEEIGKDQTSSRYFKMLDFITCIF